MMSTRERIRLLGQPIPKGQGCRRCGQVGRHLRLCTAKSNSALTDEYSVRSKEQLQLICKQAGIRFAVRWTKTQLADTLRKARKGD